MAEHYTPQKTKVRVTYGTPRNRLSYTTLLQSEPRTTIWPAITPQNASPKASKQTTDSDEAEPNEPQAKKRLVQAFLPFSTKQQTSLRPKKHSTTSSKRPTKTQAFLDFGQKPIVPEPCNECGMAYQRGREEDEQLHKQYHRKWQHSQLRVLKWDIEKSSQLSKTPSYPCTAQSVMSRILMVDPHLSKRETACALAILNHVNEQLGACPLALPDLSSKQRKIFMYISPNSRVEGCVLAELISSAYRVVPDKEPLCRSDHAEPAVCGISRIWVAQHARQRGIATQMLKAVQQMFVYGCCIKPEQIAFTQPTAAGRSLAERFFKRKDFLVYAED